MNKEKTQKVPPELEGKGWVLFWDMHSGGSTKEHPYNKIYIQCENEEQGKVIFYNRFGHNPDRISCTCCGSDYSIDFERSLKQSSGFHRNAPCIETHRDPVTMLYNNKDPVMENSYLDPGEAAPEGYTVSDASPWKGEFESLEKYINHEDVLVIPWSDIKVSEMFGEVPEQGYVWKG